MRITLKQLMVFTTIYRTGSVTQASEVLSLSQSALSSALQELERLLDTRLFERNGKKLIRNEMANKLYPKAVQLIQQANEIETEFRQTKTCLVIGASSTIGNYLLPPLIARFIRQNPQIDIRLHVYNTKEICESLLKFDYDLGFIEGENHFEELVAQIWHQDELTLFSAQNSQFVPAQLTEISLATLSQLPLILRENGSGTREIIDKLILSKLSNYQVQQLSHSEAIKQAVSHDFGIGCLSKYVLTELHQLNKIRYLTLQGVDLHRTLWLIYHRNKYISAPLAKFIQFCQQAIQTE